MRQIQLLLLLAALSSAPFCLQAQWTKTNGLRGGTASKFVAWGDTILIHNYSNTIPYSTNSGQTWSQLPLPTDVYVWDLAASGDLLAVRSYDYTAGKASVSASSDRGQTWVKVPIADTMQFSEIHVIKQYIYGSDSKGVYRSADMGATWQYVTKKWTGGLLYDGQRLTAFRYPYIVQSLDLGLTWDTLLKTTGNLIHLFQHDQHIIAFMQAAANGCYVSADYGKTWQQRTGREFDQTDPPFWHKGAVYVPDYKAILRSADLCKTWTELDPPGSTSLITGFSDGQSMLASDLYSGIFRSSDNGDSWFPTYIGLVAQEANSLREIDGTLYATGKEGPFRLAPDGLNWTLWPLPIQGDWVGFSDIIKSGDNWVVGHESDFWVSLNGGATWFQSFVGGNGHPYFYPARMEVIGDRLLVVADNEPSVTLFASDNHGLTFLPLNTLTEQFPGTYTQLAAITSGKLYAITADKKLYRSTDAGLHWELMSDNVPIDQVGTTYACNLLASGDLLFLTNRYGTTSKMAISQDGGATWAVVDLVQNPVPWGKNGIRELISVGSHLIVAVANGVYRSSDLGKTWVNWGEGLGSQQTFQLTVHDGHLWASVQSNGIWKRSLAELGLQTVGGQVFRDDNANGQRDTGEPGMGGIFVESGTTQAYAATRPDGAYSLLSDAPQEQLRVRPPQHYWKAAPSVLNAPVPGSGADFALQIDPAARDLSVSLTAVGPLRPGFEADYVLSWRNRVPLPANAELSLAYPTDRLEFISASPAPTASLPGQLLWQLGSVGADASGSIFVRARVPESVALGTEICAEAAIGPAAGDFFAADNTDRDCTKVVGSYDPNDKQAEPSEGISPTQIADGHAMTYTVRFQNTGNYPATMVRIADTLRAEFDLGSFQLLSASHPCRWQLRGDRLVEFFFDNIQLPPLTTDEPGSHGFVKYQLRPRAALPLGTPLRNTAHIFFDFNAPVVTNTTETLVKHLVGSVEPGGEEASLQVSPNPCDGTFWVHGASAEPARLLVFNILGEKTAELSLQGASPKVSLPSLPAGAYSLLWVSESGVRKSGRVQVVR